MRPARLLVLSVFSSFALCSITFAQTDVNMEQGLKPYGSYIGGNLDSVSLTNGNLTLHIPLVSYPQRGGRLNLSFFLRYNNKGYHINNTGTSAGWVWDGVGVDIARDQVFEFRSARPKYVIPTDNGNRTIFVTVNSTITPDGAAHVTGSSYGARSWDSGLLDGFALGWHGVTSTSDGTSITTSSSCPSSVATSWGPVVTEDSNGNKIATNANGWLDTLGRQIPGEPGCPFLDASVDPRNATMEMRGIYAGGGAGPSEVRMFPGVSTSDLSGCPANTVSARIWNLPTFANSPSQTNATAPMKLCYATFQIATNFGVANVGEISGPISLLQNVILPNGTMWTFNYNNYGDLTYLGLPTGGSISYAWNTFQFCGGRSRTVTSRTVSDGITSQTWNYNWTASSGSSVPTSLILTDPAGNDSVHVSTSQGGCSYYETEARYYQGSSSSSSNLLKTVDTTYTPASADPSDYYVGQSTVVDIFPAVITTTWANGQTSTVKRTYDTPVPATAYLFNCFNCDTQPQTISYSKMNGQVMTESLFDYGSSAAPIRKTTNQYYTLDDPSTVITSDGNGNKCAETDFAYDDPNRLVSSGITEQHGAPYQGAVRANPSSITHWLTTTPCSSTATWSQIPSYANYNDTGTLASSQDPLGHITSYTYSPTFYGAYITQTTLPNTGAQHIVSANYDFNTGLQISFTDQNSQTSNYTYDNMWRIKTGTYPDGGQTTFNYTDTTPPVVNTTKKITSNLNITKTLNFEGLGRPTQTVLNSDPDNPTYNFLTYDALGHQFQVYNPTRCATPTANCGELTWGVTTKFYDALGRICLVAPPDGTLPSGAPCATQPSNDVLTTYSGNTVTVTDQSGKARKSVTDALGRLTQVFEDPGSSPHLNYETDYTYDALDNLTGVLQNGSRQRTFNYDSLSRLVCASNPETSSAPCPATATTYTPGTTGYTYDANGNLIYKTSLAPNQTGTATVTLTYCYDVLNRLTAKAYTQQPCTNGTVPSPAATYLYDQASYNGLTITNGIGRRTGMTDQAGSEAWSYDSMGRVASDQRSTNGLTRTYTYAYNLDGSPYTVTHPDTLVVTFQQGGAGRPISETSGDAGYVYSVHYAPNGSLCYRQQNWGQQSTMDYTFNNRFQPVRVYMQFDGNFTPPAPCTNPTQASNIPMDFTYSYVDANGHNNGNVASITLNGDWNRSHQFTYDSLNRISTAQTVTNYSSYGGPARCWGEQFGYDPWGNLLSISPVSSAYTGCTQESLNVAVNTKNQVIGNTYDAAGNLWIAQPGNVQYTYDAENHLTSTAGQTYLYDGDGKRVEKATNGTPPVPNKIYWYGTDDSPIIETDAAGNEQYRYFRFNGTLIAREEWNDWVDHYGLDALGNVRFLYSYNGNWDLIDYYPFGGERLIYTTSDGSNTRKFTSKERDSESGLDNFEARYFGSSLGRFMSPDPFNIAGDFVDSQDPQHWNMYSYVLNNPINAVDPDGLDCVYVGDNSVSVKRGDCVSDTDNGIFVNGTVDIHSGTYDSSTGTVGFNYTNDDTGAIGKGVIGNVYPSGGVSDQDRLNALGLAGQIAAPGVNLAANGLRAFGYIVAAPLMAVAECGAAGKDCSATGTALAIIPLTGGARKILGGILPLADETVANAIRIRGGGGAQVNQVASWLAQKTVGEVANLAAQGNAEARTAVKIIKDAARLAQK